MSDRLLHVAGSPHVHGDESVKKIMWSVVIALMPAFFVAVFYFGLPVIILTAVSVLSCVLFEWLIQRFLLKGKCSVGDGSAVITGLLLAFCVPPDLPIPLIILGAMAVLPERMPCVIRSAALIACRMSRSKPSSLTMEAEA